MTRRRATIATAPRRPPLYANPDAAGWLVAPDASGELVTWPAERRGWRRRHAFGGTARSRQLVEIDVAKAVGTGWPPMARYGAGRPPGRRQPRSVRLPPELDAQVAAAAERAGKSFSDWMCSAAQRALNAE